MSSVHDWISGYATAAGLPPPSGEQVEAILELAGTAAHASARQAAPVTCWLAAQAGLTPEEANGLATDLAERLGAADG